MTGSPNNTNKSPLESYVRRASHAISKAEVVALATVLTREIGEGDALPGRSASNAARELLQLSVMLQALAEYRCNGIPRNLGAAVPRGVNPTQSTWYECDEAEADRLESEMRERASELAKPYRVRSVSTGGDPRGYPLVIHFESGKSNAWAGEGFGITAKDSTRKRSA